MEEEDELQGWDENTTHFKAILDDSSSSSDSESDEEEEEDDLVPVPRGMTTTAKYKKIVTEEELLPE
jgi:hypothetical protein